ncbi:hypothetical protein BCR41DRAFT_20607 [Lobosporangium transversale]|uniref:Uncharacterized protein n=1 Tax=Lobosporangium transversale TaxID=64571 RepID=A0A1Y2GSL0_9FUNG|nr:hypothetical protein BCR41DRAFT_20607 [Lobosporangium transversale]ORZ21775.1 hypothetical protein BCR41DRAFT_20607 [Lobosporangium transversale]|eukprot:XP_021883026.1 hypothetical protein BCR41DRAFT_20607 [Lobosporangium transversale]
MCHLTLLSLCFCSVASLLLSLFPLSLCLPFFILFIPPLFFLPHHIPSSFSFLVSIIITRYFPFASVLASCFPYSQEPHCVTTNNYFTPNNVSAAVLCTNI